MQAEKMKNPAQQGGNEPADWVKVFARIGLIAKGVVYAIIGVLAFQTAIGSGGQTSGAKGAIHQIAQESYGQILLVLMGIGLVAYTIWKFLQAALDPDNKGSDGKGIAERIAWVVSGISYGILAVFAFSLLGGGGGSGGGGGGSQEMTAKLMSQPFGIWLVGLVGVIIIASGIFQIVKGYKEKFTDRMNFAEMSQKEKDLGLKTGKIGYIARGVVFVIIGVFFIQAALSHDPSQAGGLDKALQEISSQTYGAILLGLTAIGLIAYAVYSFVLAKYRSFQ